MRFEWDEKKRISNLEKHKLDFIDASLAFDGRAVYSYPSSKNNEERWVTVCIINAIEIAVIWTRRNSKTIRIISMRRARNEERRKYHQLFS